MGARDLIMVFASAGIDVVAEGDRLVIRPASSLTDDLRAAVRDAKPELLALLPGGNGHERLVTRRDRLLRWGWPADEAEALALRLARRDHEGDDRVICGECWHFRPGACLSYRTAALQTPDVGRDLAALLQRCPSHVST